jgi:hypothetical protein
VTDQKKPYDLGNGQLCASFGVEGAWLSVSTPHPVAGLVELSGAPVFPVEQDGQVDLVRAHRAHLTEPATAMLSVVGARPGGAVADGGWRMRGDGWRARAEAWAEDTAPLLAQRFLLSADRAGALRLEFRGRIDRPGYAEITPGGPIPPALPPQRVELDGTSLTVSTPLGSADPTARLEVTSPGLSLSGWDPTDRGAVLEVSWEEPVRDASLVVTVTMTCGAPTPSPRRDGGGSMGTAPGEPPPAGPAGIELAAVRYTMGCTALEVSAGQCCILTDHRLLPLSWTRDAYYQAALLLARPAERQEPEAVVERHLAWLWRSGRDADGVWRRSHLSTGAVKDTGYQVDQQLFPLLELADFRRATGRWPGGDPQTWGAEVARLWRGLPRDDNGLAPGEENPADDPSELPYLLSSQLLLAYVARRLAEHEDELGTTDLGLGADAARTLDAVRSAFTCPGPFGDQWAYESDGRGRHRLYHDANDVPTALAPLWGLCDADDPVWRATTRFAFSAHNPGYVTGNLPGLGSAHTPGVWPLGDAQEWAIAMAEGNRARTDAVVTRIAEVASADGMLPETYDAHTGAWLARHWFAWPGSLVGLLNAAFDGRGPWVDPVQPGGRPGRASRSW